MLDKMYNDNIRMNDKKYNDDDNNSLNDKKYFHIIIMNSKGLVAYKGLTNWHDGQ